MPKKVDHHAQRRRIAQAAVHFIGQAGLEDTRLRDVAETAKVTTGAISHYFDTKDAVLEAALGELAGQIKAALSQRLSQDMMSAAAEFLPLDEDSRRDWRVWLAYLGRATTNPRLRDIHKTYYAEISHRLSDRLCAAQRAGQIDPTLSPSATADAVIAAVDGLGIRATLEPEEWPEARQRTALTLMLTALLRPTPQSVTPPLSTPPLSTPKPSEEPAQ